MKLTLYQPQIPLGRVVKCYSYNDILRYTNPGDVVELVGQPELNGQIIIPHDLILVTAMPVSGQLRLQPGDSIQPFTSIRPMVVEGRAIRV